MTLLWKGDTHVETGNVPDWGGDRIVSNLKPERQIIAWRARARVLTRSHRYHDAARCRLRALALQRELDNERALPKAP